RVICQGAQGLDGHVPLQSRHQMVHVHGKHDAPSQRSVQACFTKAVLVFSQCDEAFQHCRPVILMDATFLTGKYKGALMMAVVVDPDRQLVPLAFALTEGENNDSWSWFMKSHAGHPSCMTHNISHIITAKLKN